MLVYNNIAMLIFTALGKHIFGQLLMVKNKCFSLKLCSENLLT